MIPFTAAHNVAVRRTNANLTSIGRLTPPITATPGSSPYSVQRLLGVPPMRSVTTITPASLPTSMILSETSWRRAVKSSSAPTHTIRTASCGPITCSHAASNSAARRPCVTITTPITTVVPTSCAAAPGTKPLCQPGHRPMAAHPENPANMPTRPLRQWRAIFTFKAAETSQGFKSMRGRSNSASFAWSGSRSLWATPSRTTKRSGTASVDGIAKMPTPRTSKSPTEPLMARASPDAISTRSSATNRNPM